MNRETVREVDVAQSDHGSAPVRDNRSGAIILNQRETRRQRRRIRQGFLLLGLLTVTSTAVFFVDDVQRRIEDGPTIVVTAPSARSLRVGDEVWVAGKRAGRVVGVSLLDPDSAGAEVVAVSATILKAFEHTVRADSRARVAASGLLAPKVLAIQPGSPDAVQLLSGDTLKTERLIGPDSLLSLGRTARAALDTLEAVTGRLRHRLAEGGSLMALRRDDEIGPRLALATSRARKLKALAQESPLASLVSDPDVRESAARAMSRLRASGGEGGMGLRPDSLMVLLQEVDVLQARLESIGADLRAGRGTAGRLVFDDELQRSREELRQGIDAVRAELMRNPLRWLRFRLF
ncbi:MAG: MlaD family protein [Gemmatimonadota bacterium]